MDDALARLCDFGGTREQSGATIAARRRPTIMTGRGRRNRVLPADAGSPWRFLAPSKKHCSTERGGSLPNLGFGMRRWASFRSMYGSTLSLDQVTPAELSPVSCCLNSLFSSTERTGSLKELCVAVFDCFWMTLRGWWKGALRWVHTKPCYAGWMVVARVQRTLSFITILSGCFCRKLCKLSFVCL